MLENAGDKPEQQFFSKLLELNFYCIFSCSVKDSHSSLGQIKSIVTGQENTKDFILRLLQVSLIKKKHLLNFNFTEFNIQIVDKFWDYVVLDVFRAVFN